MLIFHQTLPQDFQQLEGYDMKINEVDPSADASIRSIEQNGAQRALLDTLFSVCGEVDEQSMRTALRW